MKNRAIAFILAFVLLFGLMLTGCGPNDNTDDKLPEPESYNGDWGNAHWIRVSGESNKNVWANYRRDFTLESVPQSALVKIACDNKYWLYVNGELVVNEGGLNRGPNESDTYYDQVDIAGALKEGKNYICVLAWYWGETGSDTHYLTSQKRAMILSTSLHDERNRLIDTGDGRWYSAINNAYTQGGTRPNIYLGEFNIKYDAGSETDWLSADFSPEKNGWEIAQAVGNDASDPGYAGDAPWNKLVLRPTPLFKNYELTLIAPDACETSSDGSGGTVYTLRMPYNMQFYPYVKLGSSTSAGLKIIAETETTGMSSLKMEYTTKSGEQEYEHKGWLSGDRLSFTVPSGAVVESLGYRQTGYAVESGESTLFRGYFDSVVRSDDPSLVSFNGGHSWEAGETSAENNFYDELWTKAVYTLYLCMRDGYMDCPDRERGQYIGDALNEIEESFYALGPTLNALSAKAVREICAGQEEYTYNGRTYYAMSCIEPFQSVHEIPIQELGTAVAAWSYYLYTGDVSLAVDCFTPLYNYLTNYDFVTEGDYEGTIRMRPAEELMKQTGLGQWTDWEYNQDTRIAINCWWYMSAVAVRGLADVEGVNVSAEQTAWLDESISKVEENFHKFWNDNLNAYATDFSEDEWYQPAVRGDGTHLVDDRVNALAVVSGLADSEKYAAIRDVFMGTDSKPAYQNASIYMEKYVLQALYMMGCPEDAMERMNLRFGAIVNDKEDSTLPEYWNKAEGTKNHGWSGGALIALSHYATGIEPTKPGYEAWEVCPQLGNFETIRTNVPSEIGDITLTISVVEDSLEMTVTSPGGNAEIWVPVVGEKEIEVTAGNASFIENRDRYGQTYAVYAITGEGTYMFISK